MPKSGHRDASTATMADAARIEPTDRSMPPVRITNVMPAPSTMLIADCCRTIVRLVFVMKRGLIPQNTSAISTRAGSMPSVDINSRGFRREREPD